MELRKTCRTAVLVVWGAAGVILPGVLLCPGLAVARAQAAPAASPQTSVPSKQIGTVKTVSPHRLIIATDAGLQVQVDVAEEARILQLPPGSTDLKTAKTIALEDIEVGDRVLATGHGDAADALTASRVILMKSSDIAQKHEVEQQDWQRRGSGGLVDAVDPAASTVTISSRGNKIAVHTTPATIFRRYAIDSVKFQDAVPGNFGQIQPGDQLRVRGTKSEDGTSIQADEIVTGSFRNLAGTIVSINAAAETLTLKDLATKKTYSIQLTPNSNLRVLPAEAAARFAARAKGSAGASASPAAGSAAPAAGPVPAAGPAGGGSPGMDLSQMLPRLPQGSLNDLHVGDAVMLVASQPAPGNISLTAITLLSGVEPILSATPSGTPSMTLSPWNVTGPDNGGA